MSVTTMTFTHGSALDASLARFGAVAAGVLRSVATVFDVSATRREPRTAAELLAWAEQYESTQPSYAADLRAAAQIHLGRGD